MAQTYFLLPTAEGEAKLANAQALGVALKFTAMSVGDGNGALPIPTRDRKTLINERRRAAINSITQDAANQSQFIAEQVIPETEGGWWIREAGIHSEDGTLCYYANIPETYKPVLAEGSARTQVIRLVCLNTSGATVELKVDPSIVLATRSYVDTQIASELDKRDAKQSALVATTGPLAALSGLQTIDAIVLTAGARVLVKDQAAAKDNGVYVAAAGAWSRATDADSGLDVTTGMLVPIEQGAINGDSVWQLTTDGPIIVGATPIAFKRVGADYFAPLASPVFTGTPKVPTAPLGTATDQAASTAHVAAAIAALVNAAPSQLDTINELAAALGNDANFAASVTNALALKAPLASPQLTGTPTAPTPPQFDASTKLATMEAVRRAGMQSSAWNVVAASGAIPASFCGSTVVVAAASSVALTLPDAAAVPVGARLEFLSVTSLAATISRSGTNLIYGTPGSGVTSLPLTYLNDLVLVSNGANWYVVGGRAAVGFNANNLQNGYEVLPSGVIRQWGNATSDNAGDSVVAFPLVFPTACWALVTTPQTNNPQVVTTQAYNVSRTGFQVKSVSNAGPGAVNFSWSCTGR
ncbi:phage tail protein [Cupriavidus campinensis]